MVQIKKNDMREAILVSAFDLFSRKGYTATTMADIARQAEMNVGTLYVYFDSKMALLYVIYRPWLEHQLNELADSVRKLRSPATKLQRLFTGLWSDIPAADHSFANALIEALALAPPELGKQDNLLSQVEVFLNDLLLEILPPERHVLLREGLLSHLIWMAFDGFTINVRLSDTRDVTRIAELMTAMVLGHRFE
ncbi:MAG TPA: TetR/AcrR family transcriptional regulator [Pusillimonas sp.]|jgi:AcrR family transcriptional regulator|nr:TetR family transcriptional regulator [Pusillimonas sp.]MBC43001.1 TetR family transcriptional regulator [Pusillimonas sp.]HBT34156.1 TetR/AcrR family transcriptional regulator [Pusillimonas sp.]HCN71284.1 TetR/AcrR family transcriptional regulator [Pusillimonas sp.]|tara:strand:- start:32153 stop:32734 length:582 start_codon:yes stop_codon:yes gene_type:complete